MTNHLSYLRKNVVAEPLINQWYAWSYLVSPASAAMLTANSHLKLMQSFVSAPQVHVSALKNPAMRGGPFLHYPADKAGEIKEFIDRTISEQAPLLELAEGIQTLSGLLETEANGFSLESLYQRVPEALKGYIELIYDLNNSASIRFIEALLYSSPYFNPSSQSICLSLSESDDRPFALSTPQINTEGRLYLKTPFSSSAWDELFKMKFIPQSVGAIAETLSVPAADREFFESLFTHEVPAPPTRYTNEQIRIRYFGHACILIESRDVAILIDPVISYENPDGMDRYTYADLPETIDYVLITHNHQDHCMFETLLQLRHRIGQILVPKNNGGSLADPSLRLVFKNLGFAAVREIDEMESVEIEGGEIIGLPFLGEHADLNIRTKLAHLIRIGDKSILCAADSNNLEPVLYKHIHKQLGDVNVLFLGMECDGGPLSWLYGPLLTKPLARKFDQSRRLCGSDCSRGMEIVDELRPSHVYIYAMGLEPWLTYLTSIQYTDESRPIVESNALVAACRSRGINSERLFGHKEILL
ncbi:MAG TPA: MBL fold metallo-hydrolase [Pyrinomonadaceae bacterium]